MGLLDSLVSRSFTKEKAGLVVVFPEDRRSRGYIVQSQSDERKIRSFLKLFYVARSSVVLFGIWLASESSRDLNNALGRPEEHVLRSAGVVLGAYLLLAAAPYMLLRRVYGKAIAYFVSAQDEVVVASGRANGRRGMVLIGVGTLVIAMVTLFAFHLIRGK